MMRFIRAVTSSHLPALLFFVALAALWSLPLVSHISTCIPGAASGDGPTFVWNNWWMRLALQSPDQRFFWTPLQFAPFGTSLVLHTHTAFPSFLSATLLGWLPLLTATNLIILSALALNGFAAYLLAHALSQSRSAALVAGVIFGGSPFVMLHMLGHFNLIHVWLLPLCLWCALNAHRRRSSVWAAAAGLAFVAAVYTDYYLAIYGGSSLLLLALSRVFHLHWSHHASLSHTWADRLFLLTAVLCGAGAVTIATSGGGVFELAGFRISARGSSNLVTIAWIALLTYTALRWGSRVRASRTFIDVRLRLVVSFIAPLLLLLPLAIDAVHLWQAGDYASQTYRWRSSPRGIDVATLLAGNPSHPLTGRWTRSFYERQEIDAIESVGWLGTPLILAACLIPAWWRTTEGRSIAGCGAVFFIWALGPWLTMAGSQTGVLLPALAVRWVPILSNARMPGRAIIVVYLTLAVHVSQGQYPPIIKQTAADGVC